MGGAKQDEAPISHAAASPRQLDEPCDCLAIPPKMKK